MIVVILPPKIPRGWGWLMYSADLRDRSQGVFTGRIPYAKGEMHEARDGSIDRLRLVCDHQQAYHHPPVECPIIQEYRNVQAKVLLVFCDSSCNRYCYGPWCKHVFVNL